MRLEDIIALAKQGYKPSDIRELIALADTDKKAETVPEEGAEPKDAGPEIPADDDQKQEAAESMPEVKADAVDYKSLYEQELLKNKRLQKENINANLGGTVPDREDVLKEIAGRFM